MRIVGSSARSGPPGGPGRIWRDALRGAQSHRFPQAAVAPDGNTASEAVMCGVVLVESVHVSGVHSLVPGALQPGVVRALL